MKKKVRVAFSILLVLSALVSLSAQAGVVIPFYTHTSEITATFSLNGSVATCYGHVEPSGNNGKASIVVKLQQKKDNKWVEFDSWSGTALAFGEIAAVTGTKTLVKGYSYRVAAYGTIKESAGNVLESVSEFSTIKTF